MNRINHFFHTSKLSLKSTLTFSVIFLLFHVSAYADWQDGAGYLELADRLDRPQDGYCLDIAGTGDWIEFNVPLNAHNCKLPGLFADGAVTFKSPGPIYFPAYEGCVTAVGLNGRSLPGAALMVKACAKDIDANRAPFISETLQRFNQLNDGRIELDGSGLCISVGAVSDRTFSPDHRWRALFLADCTTVESTRSVWKPFRPQS